MMSRFQATSLAQYKAAQQGVQWTGGYAARFLSVFVALSFSRLDDQSYPAHLPLTPTVGCSRLIKHRKARAMK
jgi:hypothetical protein